MKKNKIMRLASALLVLVMLTTCVISGTFAKYVTKTEGQDEARVAYWGFDQNAETTIDLFDAVYDNGNVKSENDANVVAPGTSKTSTFAFGYKKGDYQGTEITAPEVAYTFTVDVENWYFDATDALDANQNFVWKLQKGRETPVEYQTIAELMSAIKALSGDASGSKTYQPGELPKAFTSANEVYTIGWEWKFTGNKTYTDDTVDPAVTYTQDQLDTAMGNAQNLSEVKLVIAISATQID